MILEQKFYDDFDQIISKQQTAKFVKQLFRIQIQKDVRVLLWNQVKSRMEAWYSELVLRHESTGSVHESAHFLQDIRVKVRHRKGGLNVSISFSSITRQTIINISAFQLISRIPQKMTLENYDNMGQKMISLMNHFTNHLPILDLISEIQTKL